MNHARTGRSGAKTNRMPRWRLTRWCSAVLPGIAAMLVLMAPAAAETSEAGEKIGLVLSGGGARGLAHIGVLHVLEEEGIRPDVITGTSMGAIIGALYASGYRAAEIEQIARDMNWLDTFTDASPRHHQPYTLRQLEAGLSTDLRLSVTREGISFPRGAIQGQKLGLVLDHLFIRDGRPLTFEQLPISFAAVAADLETGEAVVLDRGEVATAVRASMSIPGALEPVELDGRMLVDGGIVDNMPVSLAREMGADRIIAVDVGAPLLSRDEIRSVFSVAQQTSGFLVRLNTLEQRDSLTAEDTLVVPQLDGLSSLAFNQAESLMSAGLDAANDVYSTQTTLAGERDSADVPQDSGRPIVSFIDITNNSVVADAVVLGLLHQRVGHALDRARLDQDVSRLYGLDYFSQVRYRVVTDARGTGLEIICQGRQSGNTWLKLGMELASDFRGNSDFSVGASLRAAGLNRLGGTAFSRFEVGTDSEIEFRFLQPLDHRLRYFVEPALGYRTRIYDIYLSGLQDEPFARYQTVGRWSSLALGRLLWGEVAEVRAGVFRERGELDFRAGLNAGEDDYDDGYYFAALGWDSLDDLGFPASGVRTTLRQERRDPNLRAEERFERTKFAGTLALSRGHTTLLLEGRAEVSSVDSYSGIDVSWIGGFLELSGLPPRSRFGPHKALVRGVMYRRMDQQGALPLGLPVYLGGSVEKGNVWFDRDEISWDSAISAGSLFVGARTFFGPAFLAYGATSEGDYSVSLFLGQRFR